MGQVHGNCLGEVKIPVKAASVVVNVKMVMMVMAMVVVAVVTTKK